MKHLLNPKKLPLLVGILGAAAMVLRQLVMAIATDSRHLVIPGHPLVIALWLVTGLTAVLVTVSVWRLGGSRKYSANFPESLAGALGCAIAAVCTMATVALGWEITRLGILRYVLGLVCGCCLIILTYARYRGIQPSFLFYVALCGFFTIHTVGYYQPWSGNPQMVEYFFEMFACMGLMLFSYQQAAFTVGMGKRRMQLWQGLMAGFFCLAAVPGASEPMLYVGGAVWTLTNLCSLTPPRRKKTAPEAPRDNTHETN